MNETDEAKVNFGNGKKLGFSFALGLQILNSWFSFPVDLPRKIIQMFYSLFYNHVLLVRSTLTASLAVPLNLLSDVLASLISILVWSLVCLLNAVICTFFSLSIFLVVQSSVFLKRFFLTTNESECRPCLLKGYFSSLARISK